MKWRATQLAEKEKSKWMTDVGFTRHFDVLASRVTSAFRLQGRPVCSCGGRRGGSDLADRVRAALSASLRRLALFLTSPIKFHAMGDSSDSDDDLLRKPMPREAKAVLGTATRRLTFRT